MRRKSEDHSGCGGGAVLECIESQLYSQKQAHEKLIVSLDTLADLERDPCLARSILMKSTISRTIEALELVDANLSELISLFDEHIGRAAPVKAGKWKIVRKIKSFIKGPFASVAINDQGLEDLKKKGKESLSLCRASIHITQSATSLRLFSAPHRFLPHISDFAMATARMSSNVYATMLRPGRRRQRWLSSWPLYQQISTTLGVKLLR